MIFPLFVFILLPFCPESPRWLAARGASLKEVATVLALLEGKGATDSTPEIHALANEIMQVAEHEAELEASSTWNDVCTSPVAVQKHAKSTQTFGGGELQNGRRLLLSGFVVGLLQQVCRETATWGVDADVTLRSPVSMQSSTTLRWCFKTPA